MGIARVRTWNGVCLLVLAWNVASVCQTPSQLLDSGGTSYSAQIAPLSADQVARKLQDRDGQRAAALGQFSGTRVYRMQYSGFPSDRTAEMVVNVSYRAPDSKVFVVVSQSGSKF